jgi:hypothetical protein
MTHCALKTEWGRFRSEIDKIMKAPDGMTVEKINQARAALGMPKRK